MVSSPSQRTVLPLITSLLAMLAMLAVWFSLSAHLDTAVTWFALVAAADIALLERWTRRRGTVTPRWIAPAATLVCCLLSLWLITALSVSDTGGFGLHDSARQMSPGLFRLLLSLRMGPADWLFLAGAPLLALYLADAGANGRRPAP